MDRPLYYLALAVVTFFQSLPLTVVGRIGRGFGAIFYWIDARHRRVALRNLTECFGDEKSAEEIRAIARENFRRIGENYCSAVKTAAMTWEELQPHCEFVGVEKLFEGDTSNGEKNIITAIGHFGNFELYARFSDVAPGRKCITTYRGLPQPSLNRLLQSLREQSGCVFFERRTDAAALKSTLAGGRVLLGLLADQHAGRSGVRVPFFGRDCATTVAPAVLALRYHCRLFTGICYRVGLGKWRIEAGDEIATHDNGRPRPGIDITRDVNRAFEKAIRRDPANWFWVHNRWKPSSHDRKLRPDPSVDFEPQPTV